MRKFQYNDEGVSIVCEDYTMQDAAGDSRILVVTDCDGNEMCRFFKSELVVEKIGFEQFDDPGVGYRKSAGTETLAIRLSGKSAVQTDHYQGEKKIIALTVDTVTKANELFDAVSFAIKYDSNLLASPEYASMALAKADADLPIGSMYFVGTSDSVYVKRVQS